MVIALFVIMLALTLVGIGYPLFSANLATSNLAKVGNLRKVAGVCTACGRHLAGDEAFCPGCGAAASGPATAGRCVHCGRTLEGDELFCPGCGKKTGEGK
jgi:RNA polymerase subunit RPABC4/transcription elongation factor Spt4